MNLGTSQVDITPLHGVELSGFAARTQPSIGVLDPLYAKGLYLVDGDTRLLWLHCDLVGFDRSIVQRFRDWAQYELGLAPSQVMLSATHTHSGPCTIHLEEAGQYDARYIERLLGHLREAAKAAISHTEPVELVAAEGRLELAVDRRQTGSAHVDPRVAGIGFRRKDRTYAAVIVNFPMHPVALGASNRCISADVPGQAAIAATAQLPGRPLAFITNGACANLNPPSENVPFAQVQAWGKQIADAIVPVLLAATPAPADGLRLSSRIVPLPLDTLDAEGINAFAAKALQNTNCLRAWGDKYRRVVERWRSGLISARSQGRSEDHHDAELFAIGLGEVSLLGVNAEVFSAFTDLLRRQAGRCVFLVGYANGDLGYLPTRAAYAEGGYEVEVAHLFYGGFRFKAGGLERLAEAAIQLLRALHESPTAAVEPLPGSMSR